MRLIFLCHVPNVACVSSLIAKLRSKNQSTVLVKDPHYLICFLLAVKVLR